MYILGIDTGPIPGIVRLELQVSRPGENLVADGPRLVRAEAVQVTPGALIEVLDALMKGTDRGAVAIERFVVGQRASRSSTAAAGERTRTMIGVVDAWASPRGFPISFRAAANVKPWATDRRLAAAGLLEPLTTGMRHARDAARHALYCAVKDYGLPDPLSRKGGAVAFCPHCGWPFHQELGPDCKTCGKPATRGDA